MIVVTTPTGTIGRQVLARLVDRRAPVRVIVRDPSRLPAHLVREIDVVVGSHRDPAVVARAFTDAQAVFWLVPVDPRATGPTSAFVDFTRPACAALRHGTTVRRVVGISALGRGFSRPAGLATASLAMDDLIAGTGVAYRALTMPAFMENLFMHAGTIREQGVIYSPVTADLPLPTVATRDVAAVAARLLCDGAWTGQDAVPLLGPEDLTFDEIARILTGVLGRPVRYQRIPVERYTATLVGQGMSAAMARAMADMLTAKNDGLDQLVGRGPEHATPTAFRDWCRQVFAPALDSVAVESSSRRFS
ncbi:NmrA family NAD(P)-binding protein [Micromonospora rifamycinica]|uniref:Uncharacterized conserved protein YbjT, contains NAD(P)-binding and DUF2867 domains n=1 Tax=Micromonospora rifamycinica TaxID=291594 RepID=A0A120F9N3_9ACTN|nr:NAD(P)H-binding protein [Micromonospora rifamycinica]KWV33649.1 NmrA family transcriptional regulator [Micromonospora rifamycinica]SCG47014.1 Uncharacterized conserved protein YbjT, contains NAD(P)-binding and DUF2867 domains [Micromonospora rifamycinica]